MSPNLTLNRYSKARPTSVSGEDVPLRETTRLDKNSPLTTTIIATKVVSSVKNSGDGRNWVFRLWNWAGHLIRKLSMRIAVLRTSIASSISDIKAFFPLLKLHTVRFKSI